MTNNKAKIVVITVEVATLLQAVYPIVIAIEVENRVSGVPRCDYRRVFLRARLAVAHCGDNEPRPACAEESGNRVSAEGGPSFSAQARHGHLAPSSLHWPFVLWPGTFWLLALSAQNLLVQDSSLAENGLQRVRQGLMTLLTMLDLGHGNGLAALGGDVAIPNLSFMRPDFFGNPLFFLPLEIEPILGGLDDVKLLWEQFHRWSCFSYWC